MLDWAYQAEKESQRRKSQIYKEILDNQILLNKHYKEQQLMKRKNKPLIAFKGDQMKTLISSNRNKKVVYLRGNKQKQQYQHDYVLPVIEDHQRFYKGKSRYRSIDQAQPKNYVTNILRTEVKQTPQTQSQVDQIIKQLQTINDKTHAINRRTSKRPKQHRKLKSNLEHINMKERISSALDFGDAANPQLRNRNYLKRHSIRRPTQKTTDYLNPYLQKLQQIKAQINQSYHSSSQRQDSLQPDVKQGKMAQMRNSSDQMVNQREKFMQILRQVNSRGKRLLHRMSNIPSSKTQIFNKINN